MDTEKELNRIAKDTARKLRAMGSLNHPPILEDNVKGDALIDVTIDVEIEVLEENVVDNDDMGSMCGTDLDLNHPQEVHEGKAFVNDNVNAGTPARYLLTNKLTERDRNLLHDPIHGTAEDRENILQSYGIFDPLLPRKTR